MKIDLQTYIVALAMILTLMFVSDAIKSHKKLVEKQVVSTETVGEEN